VPLETLKATKGLEKMVVTQKGSRLSVQPVTPAEYEIVVKLARAGAAVAPKVVAGRKKR
jgi:predicted RNA-binding protein with PUA-like domain